MNDNVPQTSCCPAPCSEPIVENIPGPIGVPGQNGQDGTNGTDAFTLTTALFVQPAVSGNVTVPVLNSTWIGLLQEVFVENGGYYSVARITYASERHADEFGVHRQCSTSSECSFVQQGFSRWHQRRRWQFTRWRVARGEQSFRCCEYGHVSQQPWSWFSRGPQLGEQRQLVWHRVGSRQRRHRSNHRSHGSFKPRRPTTQRIAHELVRARCQRERDVLHDGCEHHRGCHHNCVWTVGVDGC